MGMHTTPPVRRPARRAAVLALLTALVLLVGPAGPVRVPAAAAATGASYSYSLSPDPLGAPGALSPGSPVTAVLTVFDDQGNPAANAPVWLSFTSTAPAGGSASAGGATLSATPRGFTTGADGRVAISYETANPSCGGPICIPGPYPTSGTDTITASDAPSGAQVSTTDSYSYAAPGALAAALRYSFDPDPVAGPSSLSGGQSVPVTLSVRTPSGQPQPGATVYLSFTATAGGGTAAAPAPGSGGSCASSSLGPGPEPCTADGNGQLTITYTAGGGGSSRPSGGRDVISAADSPTAPTVSADDVYDYGPPTYSWSPVPASPPGGLGSAEDTTLSVVVGDSAGRPLPGAPVWLSLNGVSGAAAAATGAVSSTANPTGSPVLTSTPVPFRSDAYGRVLVAYETPADPPETGTDTLTAQSAASTPTSVASDTYTYGPAAYRFGPEPIAPAGSLAGGTSVTVKLSVAGAGGSGAGAGVYLSFVPADGGGSASVGDRPLTSRPAAFTADAAGQVAVVYRAPASPPRTGTDTITARDAPTAPTHTAADRYLFSGPAGGPAGGGYWLVARDGGVFSFGAARFYGSAGGIRLNQPVVAMAAVPDGGGYWLAAADGGVFSYGDAGFFGSAGKLHLARPIVAMAATPDGRGYWLAASDGGIFNYGDARFYGSGASYPSRVSSPVVGMAATPDGAGYWEVTAGGAVLAFGDAMWRGDAGTQRLNAPVVGMAATATGFGYWLVGADGGVFSYGDAFFYGSTGATHLNRPIVGTAASPDGAGYWFVASDGGVFNYGDARFYGSEGDKRLNQPIVGMAGG